MTEFDSIAAGLRSWAVNRAGHVQAAVELLIWHETWLRRPDFRDACVTGRSTFMINWELAREFIDRGFMNLGQRPLPASSSELRILDLAVALGEDQFGLAGLGHAHRRTVVQAFAAAAGVQLELPAPEAVHNHPSVIPGDPATCAACALSAEDEGRLAAAVGQCEQLAAELARVRAETAQKDSWHAETVNEVLLNAGDEFDEDAAADVIAVKYVRYLEDELSRARNAVRDLIPDECPDNDRRHWRHIAFPPSYPGTGDECPVCGTAL